MSDSPLIPLNENKRALALVAVWLMKNHNQLDSTSALTSAAMLLSNPMENFSNIELNVILATASEED